MSNMDFPLFKDSSRAIVMEPTIKSASFIKFLKESTADLLRLNKYKPKSIKTEGFYLIIFLYDDSQLVQATELLRKISGVSYIFIGAATILEHSTISRFVLTIANKLLMDNEKYFIKIETSKLPQSRVDEFTYFKHDLEFFIQTELSSQRKGLIPVKDESLADKILYILIGNNITLVSLLVFKGSDRTPFNLFQEVVACPVYDDCSLLSLVQVLDSGYMPLPIFFYRNRPELIKKLRKFEEIIRNYPVDSLTFYLFPMDDTHRSKVRSANRTSTKEDILKQKSIQIQPLVYEQAIIKILLRTKFETQFVSFPFVPFIHPQWFIQRNIKLFHKSEKILLSPLLFSSHPRTFENKLTELSDNDSLVVQRIHSRNYLDINESRDFAKVEDKYTNSISPIDFKKFILNIRKNDILDVLNSV